MRSSIDEQFMFRCITLAKLGQYHASPNPMVGAVLVYNGAIIGEGWHHKAGQPHAEVNCINSVQPQHRHLISLSTIYVSLEPCAHYGKTPPCANLIIQHKIPKVVIGCVDSFSKVSGKGIKLLQNAGIEVITGILNEECRALNKHFFTFHEKKRPYITLKWAESKDEYIAPINGKKVMLSNHYAQTLVHKMRTNNDAFLIGYQTALQDNPMLSNRKWPVLQQPCRVILDPKNQLPKELHIFDSTQRTYILTENYVHNQGENTWIDIGDQFDPASIIKALYKLGIHSVVIEGGTKTLQQFIDTNFWDESFIFQTEIDLQEGIKSPRFDRSKAIKTTIGNNTLFHSKT